MKAPTLILAAALALSSTFAFAQSSSSGAGSTAVPSTTGPVTGSPNEATVGQSMPGANAGVPRRGPTDGAMPAGNADNSGGAVPTPSSRISPGQKNEENGN